MPYVVVRVPNQEPIQIWQDEPSARADAEVWGTPGRPMPGETVKSTRVGDLIEHVLVDERTGHRRTEFTNAPGISRKTWMDPFKDVPRLAIPSTFRNAGSMSEARKTSWQNARAAEWLRPFADAGIAVHKLPMGE